MNTNLEMWIVYSQWKQIGAQLNFSHKENSYFKNLYF